MAEKPRSGELKPGSVSFVVSRPPLLTLWLGYQDRLVFLSLLHSGNLTAVSNVCKAVTISLFLALKRFNEAF